MWTRYWMSVSWSVAQTHKHLHLCAHALTVYLLLHAYKNINLAFSWFSHMCDITQVYQFNSLLNCLLYEHNLCSLPLNWILLIVIPQGITLVYTCLSNSHNTRLRSGSISCRCNQAPKRWTSFSNTSAATTATRLWKKRRSWTSAADGRALAAATCPVVTECRSFDHARTVSGAVVERFHFFC